MSDMSYSQRVLRQADLMARMMSRLGVDLTDATGRDGGLAWYEAQAKCIFCRNARMCADWLKQVEPIAGSAEFCPNTKFFWSCGSQIPTHCGSATRAP